MKNGHAESIINLVFKTILETNVRVRGNEMGKTSSKNKIWIRRIGYVRVGKYRGVLYQNTNNRSVWKWRGCIVKADGCASAILKFRDQNAVPKDLKA